MDKTFLDKVTEHGMVKCYSEDEILNRKIVGRGGFGVVYKA
ncbi:2290_t:CDS:1, partial [Paraglomus occultum]